MRTPVKLKIKFRSGSLSQFIERYSVDVSKGGIFIRTKDPLEVGTKLRFEFQLQDGSPLIVGTGTVVWIREHDPSRKGVAPGMGVRFDELQPESKQVLNEILNRKSGADPVMSDDEVAKSSAALAARSSTRLPQAPKPAAPAKQAAAKTEAKSEAKPEAEPAPKPEEKPEEKAEEKPDEKPDEKPEEQAEVEPEDKAEDKAEDKPAEEADDEPAEKPAAEPDAQDEPEDKAEDEPAEKADEEPEDKVEDKPAPAAKSEEAPAEKKPADKPKAAAQPKPAEPAVRDRPASAAEAAARGERKGGGGKWAVIILVVLLLGGGVYLLITRVLNAPDRGGKADHQQSNTSATGPTTPGPDAEAMRADPAEDAAVAAMRPDPPRQRIPDCPDGILTAITSEPAGGKIFLNKKDTGQVTPGTICVAKNRRKKVLMIKKDLYKPGYLYFRSVKGGKLEKVVLRPISYRIVIKTAPKRARVWVNDKYEGQTTLSFKIPPADNSFKIKIEKKGYKAIELSLERSTIKWRKQSRVSYIYAVHKRLVRDFSSAADPTRPRRRPMRPAPMDPAPMDPAPMDPAPMDPPPMRVEPMRPEPMRVEPMRPPAMRARPATMGAG